MSIQISDGESAEVLERLRSDREQAIADLFSQHRARLWRMVHLRMDARLYGRVDADDVLQEAYLDAVARIDHYLRDPSSSLFIWLQLIVGQTLINVHRRHLGTKMCAAGREVTVQTRPDWMPNSSSMAAQLLGKLTSPSQAAIKAEMVDRLEQAVQNMNPMDRDVLVLRHFEDLTNCEVAEVLGIRQKAASIRYVRAIRRLKDVLSAWPEFVDM